MYCPSSDKKYRGKDHNSFNQCCLKVLLYIDWVRTCWNTVQKKEGGERGGVSQPNITNTNQQDTNKGDNSMCESNH